MKWNPFWGHNFLLHGKNTYAKGERHDKMSWDIFITWKIKSGLVWAASQYMKKKVWGRLWATFEGVFFYVFKGKKEKKMKIS